jgi:ribosomal-protein-alanine N-acetyltransferase
VTGTKSDPFPILKTERLTLRQLTETDVKAIYTLRSNESVNRYIKRSRQVTLDEAKTFINKINVGINQHSWIYWAICLKDTTDLVGTICLWNFSDDKTMAELGYELDPTYQGQGYLNEALKSVVLYAFVTIGLTSIEAYTHRENLSSTRLLEKNKFRLDPTKVDEGNTNNIVYRLTKDE